MGDEEEDDDGWFEEKAMQRIMTDVEKYLAMLDDGNDQTFTIRDTFSHLKVGDMAIIQLGFELPKENRRYQPVEILEITE